MSSKKLNIILGLSLLILGEVSIVLGASVWRARHPGYASFKNEPVIVEGFKTEDAMVMGEPKRIFIPELSIDLPVKKAEIVDGYWQVFNDSAGWGEGSGVPGQPGNQVIFAHARQGLFLPLGNARKGMEIEVATDADKFFYEILEIKEVYPDQTEIIAPSTSEVLTLYTCTGFQDAKRLIVVARRIQ